MRVYCGVKKNCSSVEVEFPGQKLLTQSGMTALQCKLLLAPRWICLNHCRGNILHPSLQTSELVSRLAVWRCKSEIKEMKEEHLNQAIATFPPDVSPPGRANVELNDTNNAEEVGQTRPRSYCNCLVILTQLYPGPTSILPALLLSIKRR